MAFGKITPKQQEILDYIKEEILKKGYPPTVREICETVSLKSTSSVHSHLESLEKNWYLYFQKNRQLSSYLPRAGWTVRLRYCQQVRRIISASPLICRSCWCGYRCSSAVGIGKTG